MPSPSRYYSSTAAKTTLSVAIDSASTSLQIATASGLPSQYPFTLILEKDTANEEIVNVTALVGTAYTIARGQDGTTAKAHNIGAIIEHGVSARDFTESRAHEVASTAHNVTGDVVGTGGAQTLTSKTLTSPAINGGTITTATHAGGTLSGAFTSTATITGGTITGATITGLSSAGMVDSSATPKNYVDSILGSAVAASTSAASAATSATAAATSAASASASASAAATSAASALASQTAAATSASSALTSQTAAATSAASALTSQTAAATSATSAEASATAAATSATSASASASAAATSATTASNSAATATTSAGQAATSATSAAASATAAASSATTASASVATIAGYASAAATSEANALTSANSAATSAASAAASTSAAAASASSAAASASAAATSASSAATTYDAFDDRYLGSKATPPSVDNDGNALIEGALYWNSVDNAMYAWTGTEWGSISSTAAIYRFRYTASGSETSESGPDDNGVTLSYLPGKEQVYLNGVLLVRAQDYTASNGTSITGLSPALSAGDVLEIITFTAFDLATVIPNTIFDAKGDLIAASAADTAGKLSVGSDGQVLTASSTAALGLTWSSPAAGYSAPTLGTTVVTSGVTITTISGLTDVVLNGPGSLADEIALLLMGAL
ncbi:tail fiber protein [Freshwater phage uvFW-CGR-AMD-COM-C403]|nr:tail fiber protein [Freshwater phage uvFW-CGR-AMD-COM-C403]